MYYAEHLLKQLNYNRQRLLIIELLIAENHWDRNKTMELVYERDERLATIKRLEEEMHASTA